jgi:hypothetical protein
MHGSPVFASLVARSHCGRHQTVISSLAGSSPLRRAHPGEATLTLLDTARHSFFRRSALSLPGETRRPAGGPERAGGSPTALGMTPAAALTRFVIDFKGRSRTRPGRLGDGLRSCQTLRLCRSLTNYITGVLYFSATGAGGRDGAGAGPSAQARGARSARWSRGALRPRSGPPSRAARPRPGTRRR